MDEVGVCVFSEYLWMFPKESIAIIVVQYYSPPSLLIVSYLTISNTSLSQSLAQCDRKVLS